MKLDSLSVSAVYVSLSASELPVDCRYRGEESKLNAALDIGQGCFISIDLRKLAYPYLRAPQAAPQDGVIN
jgi:hypothetical protein